MESNDAEPSWVDILWGVIAGVTVAFLVGVVIAGVAALFTGG